MAEAVEGAGVEQAFETLAVHGAGHALYKVEDICKQAVFFPLLNNSIHHIGAKALDGAQGKADISALIHGKVVGALVYIGA